MSDSVSSSLPPHRVVHVDLGSRAYDVLIGTHLLSKTGELLNSRELALEGAALIIHDDGGALKHVESVRQSLLARGLPAYRKMQYNSREGSIENSHGFPAGESSKSLNEAQKLLSVLAEAKIPRSGAILALGGGVVGDLAGFVSAIYLRGINFVQIPTTLLAMVDSSVGGKTGVNLPEGKNLVGAFHQPKLVIVDLDTLKTLPAREFAAGMAEVIKYGAIRDAALFERVSRNVSVEDEDLDWIVETCVAIKARIVENDEFETKGERALLNFGHTIGHAIEKAGNYTAYLHGEAISLGMRAAAWLSVWHLGLPESDALRIEAALAKNHLPLVVKPEIDRATVLGALGNDKKVAADGKNRWVLLKALGEATSGHELPGELVERAVDLIYTTP